MAIVKISIATYKNTIDSSTDFTNARLLAKSTRELLGVIVTAGSADIVVGIYDTNDSTKLDPKTALWVGANQGETMPVIFHNPMPFRNGLYVQIEEGGASGPNGPSFNGKVTLLYD